MKFLPLIWSGLWRKPARTIFTTLSLVAAFILFGAFQGLSSGFDSILASARLDRMFTDPRFGTPVPVSYTEQIAGVAGVKVVAPRDGVFGYLNDPKNGFGIITSDERFFAVRDEIQITPAQIAAWRKTRDGIVVGTGQARRNNLKVGDAVTVRSQMVNKDGTNDFTFHVVCIVDETTNPGDSFYVIGNYEYVNESRKDGGDKVSRFLLLIDNPDHAPEIAKNIDALFANSAFPTRTQSDRVSTQSGLGSLGDINFFVNAIVGSVLFMLLFLTTNTMMQSYRERIPEFGVLKTLGFTDEGVSALVIGEALVQCLLGAGLGLALGRVLMTVLHGRVNLPGMVLQVPTPVILGGLVLGVVVALISVGLPAWRARKLNVVEALTVR